MGHSALPAARPDAPLYARAAASVPDLARRTVAHCVAEVPFYALLPRHRVDGEITEIVGDHLRLFLRVLREGRLPTEAELAGPVSATVRRSGDWAPLAAVLTAYRIGGRVGWQELIRLAEPADTEDLMVAGAYLLEYVQTITAALAAAYLEEEQAVLAERRESRRALVQALLSGEPAAELAERAGVPIGTRHLVLTLRCDTAPDGPGTAAAGGGRSGAAAAQAGAVRAAGGRHDGDPAAVTATRRRVNRIREELDAFARTPVLSALDTRGGIALLPASAPGSERELTDLVERLGAAAGTPVTAAVVEAAEPGAIPAAADEAREVALIAVRLGYPPGLYRLDDVLLEYQLTRPGPARDRLARRLDPLAAHTTLLDTLQTFLRHGNSRRQAAKELHVHPNTLDYRLRRVAAFTGLDPLAAPDARLLSAALIARSLHGGA